MLRRTTLISFVLGALSSSSMNLSSQLHIVLKCGFDEMFFYQAGDIIICQVGIMGPFGIYHQIVKS